MRVLCLVSVRKSRQSSDPPEVVDIIDKLDGRLRLVEDLLSSISKDVTACIQLVVDARSELDTLRGRFIEHSDRIGAEVNDIKARFQRFETRRTSAPKS